MMVPEFRLWLFAGFGEVYTPATPAVTIIIIIIIMIIMITMNCNCAVKEQKVSQA